MRTPALPLLLFAAALGLSIPLAGQLSPLSEVFPAWVPTVEPAVYRGPYTIFPNFPAAVALQHGFAVTSLSTTSLNDQVVNGRVFDLSGQVGPPFLGEFLGNGADPELRPPAVGAVGAEGFVVAWVEGPHSLRDRRFGPGGAPLGPATYLLDEASGLCSTAVAGNAAGAFVVAAEYCINPGLPFGLFARGFDASGAAATGDLSPALSARGREGMPRVGMDALGRFVVVWRQEGETASDPPRVCGRAYGVRGGFLGSPFCAGELAGKTGGALAVDPAGSSLVAWFGAATGASAPLFVRRYQMDGVALGEPVQVAAAVNPAQLTASADSHGNAALSWQEGDQLRVLLVSRDAVVKGAAITLSGVASDLHVYANGLALGDSGRLLVTWLAAGADHIVYGQLWQARF